MAPRTAPAPTTAVACLVADPRVMERTGGAYASWQSAKEYGFTDVDGRRLDFDGVRRQYLPEK